MSSAAIMGLVKLHLKINEMDSLDSIIFSRIWNTDRWQPG